MLCRMSLSLRKSREGQELVEYALLAGFIAVTVAAVIPYQATGPVSTIFSKVGSYLVTLGGG
ncbi:MAG: Flp family type IVb pilin [Candidatus Solibacter usitatus]|nr:Flp family type IVb pilin [Candidatus Solibacter usitatus]